MFSVRICMKTLLPLLREDLMLIAQTPSTHLLKVSLPWTASCSSVQATAAAAAAADRSTFIRSTSYRMG